MSESLDRRPELLPAIQALHSFKFNPPDQIVPYLIAEYGLTEIEDFIRDPREILREGIIWQRLIGTPAAIHKSLRWINHDGDIEEFPPTKRKWWWFQIHLPFEVRNSDFVKPMNQLVKASKPLRSEFARVTAGWDVRAFIVNKHRLNGDAFLNDWSGVRRAPGEPVLSLRVNRREPVSVLAGGGTIRATRYLAFARPSYFNMPVHQQSARFVSGVVRSVVLDNRATVPFQNAPFTNHPFGTPAVIVQRGQ